MNDSQKVEDWLNSDEGREYCEKIGFNSKSIGRWKNCKGVVISTRKSNGSGWAYVWMVARLEDEIAYLKINLERIENELHRGK